MIKHLFKPTTSYNPNFNSDLFAPKEAKWHIR